MHTVSAVFLAVHSAVTGALSDQLIPAWLQKTILGNSQVKILAFNLTFCKNGADFCTESVHYPEEEIARAFHAQSGLIQSMFHTGYRPSQGDRSGMDTLLARRKVCDMMTRYIRPKAAKNKEGQFMFLVNDIEEGEEEHVQLVRVGQCLGEGEECGKEVSRLRCSWEGIGC
jgi:hypothetical protein